MEGLVILEQFTIQPERHVLFNMLVLAPRLREEAVFLLMNPKEVRFIFNVQHNCSSGTCKPTGKQPTLQERQETQLEESFIEHDAQVSRFIINTASPALGSSHGRDQTVTAVG
ncbi:hypothetical protein B0H14DRAFT_3504002 [Mycena olivaceomarginata]|nr:hypothetical protein B0H14DRAFT_3504002 [Mycena olivaceomarginata]